jgi:hypothetical protein
MKPLSADTHPDAEAVQLDLMRRMSSAERVMIARNLGIFAFALMHRSLREAYPEAPESELKLKFIELQYGSDLADRVRAYCRNRSL